MVLPRRAVHGRPQQVVGVFALQRRGGQRHRKPWVARWRVDGVDRSRSFRTRAEADRYRSRLLAAQEAGERFDRATGEPDSWVAAGGDLHVADWARRWAEEQWEEWQPRTRASAVEALTRFVVLAVADDAAAPPESIRAYATAFLTPGRDLDDSAASSWLDRWSLPMVELTRERLAVVDRGLGLRLDGALLSATTANRFRTVSKSCLRRAVELEIIQADPWPPVSRGRARRKVNRQRPRVNVRALPRRATMERIIRAMATRQPGSLTYQSMTSVAFYGGLRPSEVVMLRVSSLSLPVDGWGRIDVTEADDGLDEPCEPKTGPREVPIPPVLVSALRGWILLNGLGGEDLLFRTRGGQRPSQSNWARSLHRATDAVGAPRMRVYDCRHAAATTWLKAGVPLGEVARRLGHGVETLVAIYVGALDGDEAVANARIERALAEDDQAEDKAA